MYNKEREERKIKRLREACNLINDANLTNEFNKIANDKEPRKITRLNKLLYKYSVYNNFESYEYNYSMYESNKYTNLIEFLLSHDNVTSLSKEKNVHELCLLDLLLDGKRIVSANYNMDACIINVRTLKFNVKEVQ